MTLVGDVSIRKRSEDKASEAVQRAIRRDQASTRRMTMKALALGKTSQLQDTPLICVPKLANRAPPKSLIIVL